jgi:hypothetical protein
METTAGEQGYEFLVITGRKGSDDAAGCCQEKNRPCEVDASMTREELLQQLEELAGRLNIQVQYESLKNEDPSTFGGFCRIRDQHIIILHSKASINRKIEIFTEALRRFDIDDFFMRPVLREHLKKEDIPDG